MSDFLNADTSSIQDVLGIEWKRSSSKQRILTEALTDHPITSLLRTTQNESSISHLCSVRTHCSIRSLVDLRGWTDHSSRERCWCRRCTYREASREGERIARRLWLTVTISLTPNKPITTKAMSLTPADTLKITLTTRDGSTARRPHQAFLQLQDMSSGLSDAYPFSVKDSGKGKVEIVCIRRKKIGQ